MVRKHLDTHIRTIVVLTSGKLAVFKLCNYGKNVWYDFVIVSNYFVVYGTYFVVDEFL
jgi:hypothetical protein